MGSTIPYIPQTTRLFVHWSYVEHIAPDTVSVLCSTVGGGHDMFCVKLGSKRKIWKEIIIFPIESMHGIFPYIWLIFMVNVSKYTSPMDPMGLGMI